SATPPPPLCPDRVARAPRCACSRRSPRSGLAAHRSQPPRSGPAARFPPATPIGAVAALDGALASAPSDGRAGEPPVASVTGNVSPAPPADQYLRLKSAPVSSDAPVLGRAPWHAGRRASSSAAGGFAADLRIPRNSPVGRACVRKKSSWVITLAASLSASGSGG